MRLAHTQPRLKPCTITVDGDRVLIEDSASGNQIALPANRKPIAELLDGTRTVKQIVSVLVETYGHVSFRDLFYTLQTLEQNKLLTEPLGLTEMSKSAKNPTERAEAFVLRPLFELRLLRRLGVVFLKNRLLLLSAAAVIFGVSLDSVIFWLAHPPTRGFLALNNSYANAVVYLLAFTSILMVFKGLAKSALLLLTTGQFHNFKLRFHPFGLSVAVSDTSVNTLNGTIPLLLYFLAASCLYLFPAALAPEFFGAHPLIHSFEALAILLTFLELDPYRKSELTLLLDRFFKDDEQRHLTAYLKNRALFSAASFKQNIRGEVRLVLYSVLALAWTVGFLLFSMDLLSKNLPNLMLAVMSEDPRQRISAGVILTVLTLVFGTLLFDLLGTITRNLVFPILNPYLRILQKLRSSDVKNFDLAKTRTLLRNSGFFQDLEDSGLDAIITASKMRSFKRGTRLIIQGERGRELFLLIKGSVSVLKREDTGLQSHICTLQSGSVFGEIALLKDCVRTADVVANEDIQALIVEKGVLHSALGEGRMKGDYERILDRVALGHYLSSTPLFRELPAETLGVFTSTGTFEHRFAADVVIQEGERGNSFYLVLRGELQVSASGKPLATLKQGDFFGEIALLTDQARTATVTAATEVLLLRLESSAFWEVLTENLPLAMSLENVAEQRLGAAPC